MNLPIVTVLACGLVLSGSAPAQKYYRDASKPSIFVTFSRTEIQKPLWPGEGAKRVYLRLHNNTNWDLLMPAYGVSKVYGDCGFFFEVVSIFETQVPGTTLRRKDIPAFDNYRVSHANQVIRMTPGEVLEFSVPAETLGTGLAIRLPFNYGWESKDGHQPLENEPVHVIVFTSAQIPESAR